MLKILHNILIIFTQYLVKKKIKIQNNLICVLNPVVIIHVLLLICSFNWNRSAKNDGRSNVDDQSEFKVLSNCCYPNCGHFVSQVIFPWLKHSGIMHIMIHIYHISYIFFKSLLQMQFCVFVDHTLFYYWITALVFCVLFFCTYTFDPDYLCICVLLYLCTCELIFLIYLNFLNNVIYRIYLKFMKYHNYVKCLKYLNYLNYLNYLIYLMYLIYLIYLKLPKIHDLPEFPK